ncbi:hypothetical protein V493_02702 [Pseudogymnoascus sp. VKM F-4281 (FW-2241)]|nr:hypothetical protein V493_02702 [Pseudogymnoascus sp. VKM F-4281 (FW-2241)]
MPASTHQAKRPYAGTHSQHHQSSITSYFPSPSGGAAPSQTTVRNTSSPPVLPATVQSSLLNVGMRVRKSVPEGYKTGTYSSFALFSDQAPPSKPQQQQQQQRRVKHAPGSAARELAPFCGIMKVGGLAVQAPQGRDEEYLGDEDEVPDEDDVPGMSSQGSTLSAYSTTVTHKRRLSASSSASDDDEGAAQYSWADMEISPKTQAPQPGQAWGGAGNRAMALPRRMKKAGAGGAMGGQENGGGAGVDFEEAGFLDYAALGEVDMGGL